MTKRRRKDQPKQPRLISSTVSPEAMATYPIVSLVGRPNVGKSSVFNRLSGKRLAVVEDIAGVTRDRHYACVNLDGYPCVLVDTGGFDPETTDPMHQGIAQHVREAIAESDVIVCVLEATTEPTPLDQQVIALLRQSDKPVVYVGNKADSVRQELLATAHYALGLDHLLPISAAHGHGMATLRQAVVAHLPDEYRTHSATDKSESHDAEAQEPALEQQDRQDNHDSVAESIPHITLVGRPNAGKSSLVNRLLRTQRHLVDDRPGTTVDSIDSYIESQQGSLIVTDTAGMRRKSRVARGVESKSVVQSVSSMQRSDVAVLMVDGTEGIAEQDTKIVSLSVDRGCGLVVGLNKADLLSETELRQARQSIRETLAFAPWAPLITLSTKTGRGIPQLLRAVHQSFEQQRKRIPTAALNRFLENMLMHHPPPAYGTKVVRFYYMTQAETKPPLFVIITNEPKGIHFSYQRYMINQLRDAFGFKGTPIRVVYRAKKKRMLT